VGAPSCRANVSSVETLSESSLCSFHGEQAMRALKICSAAIVKLMSCVANKGEETRAPRFVLPDSKLPVSVRTQCLYIRTAEQVSRCSHRARVNSREASRLRSTQWCLTHAHLIHGASQPLRSYQSRTAVSARCLMNINASCVCC
jgi:hypothetical protein